MATAANQGTGVAVAFVGSGVSSYTIYLLNLAMFAVMAAVGLNLLTGNSGQISLCHSSFMAIGAYVSSLLAARYGVPVRECELVGLVPLDAQAPPFLLRGLRGSA